MKFVDSGDFAVSSLAISGSSRVLRRAPVLWILLVWLPRKREWENLGEMRVLN